MNYSGNENLFTSHFVMGTILPDFKKNDCVQALKSWIHFKNEDWAMKNFNTDRTQYISFLHIIELSELKLLLQDLVSLYKKSFRYGTKDDFLEHVFGYTLFDLNRIISRDYSFHGAPPHIKHYEFYYYFENQFNEFLDFAIPVNDSIENYKQYYRNVIQMIKDVDFDSEKFESTNTVINVTENIQSDYLESIWLANPKISIQNLIKAGIDSKIWDEKCNLITQRNGLYGSGKRLLGSLSIALKDYSISEDIHYKKIGEVFCKKFNIVIKNETKDPYKAFGTGNSKIIKQFKRWLNVNF